MNNEDIKVLENIINELKGETHYLLYTNKEKVQAIENLIKGYKELEEELRPIKNIEKALDEMDIEGMWNDIKAEDYIPKSKIEKEFEKFTTHNNCFNLGDMQLLLDNILEED